MCRTLLVVFTLVSVTGSVASGQQATTGALRPGAKVFINPMPDDFDSFLKAAFAKKKVPLTIVDSKDNAELEITGSSETQKATTAKKLLRLSFSSDEQAAISIADFSSRGV